MLIKEASPLEFDELNAFYIRMNEVINVRTHNYNPDNAVFPSTEMIKDAIASGQQFVGIENGIIVAACIVIHDDAYADKTSNWNVVAPSNECWILHALRVLPEYEGKGLAKQMLSFIISLAPKRMQKAIRLDVLEGYSVERLYTAFGFKYIDTVEILYDDIGYPQRFRLYELPIT